MKRNPFGREMQSFVRTKIREGLIGTPSSEASIDLYNRGTLCFMDGSYESAVDLLQQAVLVDPTWLDPYINLTAAFRKLGRMKDAVVTAQQAVSIDPYSVYTHNNLGLILLTIQKYEDALKEFETSEELDPYDRNCLLNMAITCRRLGQLEKAVTLNQRIIYIHGGDTLTYHNLSIVYDDLGNTRQAILAEIKALKTLAKENRHYLYLAALLFDLNRIASAQKMIEQEVLLVPSDPIPHIVMVSFALDEYFLHNKKSDLSTAINELKIYSTKSKRNDVGTENLLQTLKLLRYLRFSNEIYRLMWKYGRKLETDPFSLDNFFSTKIHVIIGQVGLSYIFNIALAVALIIASFAINIIFITPLLVMLYPLIALSKFDDYCIKFTLKSAISDFRENR